MAFFFIVAASLSLSGCGGSSTVTRTSAKAPEQIRSAAFVRQDGNSSEVTAYIAEALATQGVATQAGTATRSFKSNDVDAIVSYLDVWHWDVVTYLKSIAISLYNAKTGELLVTGRWRDSFLHTYYRGDSVSRDLINEMFAKLQLKPADTSEVAVLEAKPPAPLVAAEPKVSPNKANGSLVSRNEYAARQQARELQCQAQAILSIEGLGSPREEIIFDCGGGRKVTIVCRGGLGCS